MAPLQLPGQNMKEDMWGFGVKPNMVSWSWIKLLLDNGQAKTHYDDVLLEARRHPEKTPEGLISDYLSGVYKAIVKTLERRVGKMAIDKFPFEFWFTIPAIWSDQAKEATIKAARAAGFASRQNDHISLIPEPEAAALAVLRELSRGLIVSDGDGVA